MKNVLILAAVWFLAPGSSPLHADDFRIEWLSGRLVNTLKLEAAAAPIQICSADKPNRCLVVPPGDSAVCTRAAHFFQCTSTAASAQWGHFTAVSKSPFMLAARFTKSGRDGGGKTARAGAAEVQVNSRGSRVVLKVDREAYVAGVLRGEAGILKSPQALQAMAVVARTWALQWRGRHRREGFDFCSLTHCQVCDASPPDPGQTPDEYSRAVLETRGEVLRFHGKMIDVYFNADCGGMTEAAQNIWPDRAANYLTALKDPYCAGSEHSAWQQTISLDDITRILRGSMGIPIHVSLRDMKIETQDGSGRARALRLVGGSSRRIDANEFRYAVNRKLGWNTLKSNLYTLERRGDSLIFTGRGLGHGVGLCQAGAERMGQLGISSPKILSTYFPGTDLAQIQPEAQSDPILSSEHFEFAFPESQQAWANEVLRSLEAARRDLESRVGGLPAKVKVGTFATTPEFIQASGLPGWAAASTDGRSILLQPLSTLKRKNILDSTLRHELAHVAIHRRRSPKVPRWYEEGMALYFTGKQVGPGPAADLGGRTLEQSISHPHSEAEMKAAYVLALARVGKFARRHGEQALWKVLENPSAEDLQWLGAEK